MAAHAPAQHKNELSNGMLGFILFLASEVMFFGGLFAAYFIARADSPVWPPALSPDQEARGVELELEFMLPFIATWMVLLPVKPRWAARLLRCTIIAPWRAALSRCRAASAT